MGKLEKFLAKPKVYNIGGEDLELKPLTVENIDLIMDLDKPDKQAGAMKEVIKLTLKGAGATDEEISQFGLSYFKELVEAILDINGLKEDKKKGDSGTK